MKKYIVCVRRIGEKRWTAWTDTNDINIVIQSVKTIESYGWEYTIIDNTVSYKEVINYLDMAISNYEKDRDTYEDKYNAIFFSNCNGKITALTTVKGFVEGLVK